MSLLVSQEFEHPRQVSRVRLNLYRYQLPPEERVAGMPGDREGFLLTEDRVGTTTVVASLGFFADESEGRARLRQRAEELARQGYATPQAPPLRPSIPAGPLVTPPPEDTRAALALRAEPPRVRVAGDPTPRPKP